MLARFLRRVCGRQRPVEPWEPGMAEWYATVLGEIAQWPRKEPLPPVPARLVILDSAKRET